MQPQFYERMVRAIYDGILAPDGWQSVLHDLLPLVNGEQNVLLLLDRSNDVVLIDEHCGADLMEKMDYESNYAKDDPGKRFADKIAIGDWYFDQRDLGRHIMETHPFYQEFMRKHGLRSIMWTPLFTAGSVYAALSFQGGMNRSPFHDDDAKAVAPLLPHLAKAALLRWRFQEVSQLARFGQHVLNQLQNPILIIDAKARILFANTAGQTWLSEQQNPFSHQARLQQATPWPQLLQLARQICGKADTPVVSVRIETAAHSHPTFLVGLPLRDNHPVAQSWQQQVGIVIVHGGSAQRVLLPELLRQLFMLTAAECRLVEALAQHHSATRAAKVLGIGIETARTQLKAVFQKTGRSNQSALMQLITELSHYSATLE